MTVTSVGNAGLLTGKETSAKAQEIFEKNKFDSLVKNLQKQNRKNENLDAIVNAGVSSSKVVKDSRLSGEFISTFENENPTVTDKHSRPVGAASNQAGPHGENRTIDRTSKLYEKALELESYVVKIMLSSMRNTISKTDFLGGNSFATKMYEDMMYDEYSTALTKNAGFGLADLVYLQLSRHA